MEKKEEDIIDKNSKVELAGDDSEPCDCNDGVELVKNNSVILSSHDCT